MICNDETDELWACTKDPARIPSQQSFASKASARSVRLFNCRGALENKPHAVDPSQPESSSYNIRNPESHLRPGLDEGGNPTGRVTRGQEESNELLIAQSH